MKKLSLLLILLSTAAYAGICDDDMTGKAASVAPPEIQLNIWRYFGQSNFESAYHTRLTKYENGYQTDVMGYARENFSYGPVGSDVLRQIDQSYLRLTNPLHDELQAAGEGETIYERLQNYSLGLMKDIDYVESAATHIRSSFNLNPNQVTIFEATIQKRESELKKQYGKIPSGARRSSEANAFQDYQSHFDFSLIYDDWVEPVRDPIYDVKTALSWLLAGQNNGEVYEIPVEEGLEKPIDRQIYKSIWEVGRAGQTRLDSFRETLRASAYMAYYELLVNGGDLESAFIFAHSLDERHTRLYKAFFGMTEYSGYKGRPNETSLVASLKDMLRVFPLSEFSGIDDLAARIRNHERTNIVGESKFGKFYIRDFNAGSPEHESRDWVGDYARQEANNPLQTFHTTGVYDNEVYAVDKSGFLRLRPFLERNHGIEVVLSKDYKGSNLHALNDALTLMKRKPGFNRNQRLCLTSDFKRLYPIDRFPYVSHWFLQRNKHTSQLNIGGGRRMPYTMADAIDIRSYCFTVEEIESWELKAVKVKDTRGTRKTQLESPEYFAP